MRSGSFSRAAAICGRATTCGGSRSLLSPLAWLARRLVNTSSKSRLLPNEVSELTALTNHEDVVSTDADHRLHRVRVVRAELHAAGPKRSRPFEADFERVALPAAECDSLRDTLVAHGAHVVIEAGLAYGSSALAIGEA